MTSLKNTKMNIVRQTHYLCNIDRIVAGFFVVEYKYQITSCGFTSMK